MIKPLTVAGYHDAQFFKPPAWRFDRATAISKGQTTRVRHAEEDVLVMELRKYFKAEDLLRGRGYQEIDRGRRLMQRWPEIAIAMELYSKQGVSLPKTSLEARILAGCADDKIAARFGVSPEVVAAYRMLFFDVTDRLDCVEYIAGFVIGPIFQAGLEALNPELLAKYFGYFGGELLLENVLFGMTRQRDISSDGQVIGYLETMVARNIKNQVATATLLMQPSRFDVSTLIEGFVSVVQMEHQLRDGQEEQTWTAGLIELLRQISPIPRSTEERQAYSVRVNAPAGDLPLEPRASQRLLLASGALSTAELESRLSNFKLPDPTGRESARTVDR